LPDGVIVGTVVVSAGLAAGCQARSNIWDLIKSKSKPSTSLLQQHNYYYRHTTTTQVLKAKGHKSMNSSASS
jgi:hypothetical protein